MVEDREFTVLLVLRDNHVREAMHQCFRTCGKVPLSKSKVGGSALEVGAKKHVSLKFLSALVK